MSKFYGKIPINCFLRIGLKPKHRKFSLNQKIYKGTEYDVAVSKHGSFKRI